MIRAYAKRAESIEHMIIQCKYYDEIRLNGLAAISQIFSGYNILFNINDLYKVILLDNYYGRLGCFRDTAIETIRDDCNARDLTEEILEAINITSIKLCVD